MAVQMKIASNKFLVGLGHSVWANASLEAPTKLN